MTVLDSIEKHRERLLAIAARHGARNLRIFGSVARGEDRPDSDVDILVDLDPERGFGDYLALAEEIEALLGRRVDLVTERGLSPFLRPYVMADARLL